MKILNQFLSKQNKLAEVILVGGDGMRRIPLFEFQVTEKKFQIHYFRRE